MLSVDYVHLPFGDTPRFVKAAPFRAVVVIEQDVSEEWRDQVSEWLVRSGCLYMCAWGRDCSKWDDSVDHANLRDFDYGEIPDDRFVMTTWHADEPISEAFWFAGHCADHPTVPLPRLLIVDVAQFGRGEKILAAFEQARLGEG